jgi:hypothetical protein
MEGGMMGKADDVDVRDNERKLFRQRHFNVNRYVRANFFGRLANRFRMWLSMKEVDKLKKLRNRDIARHRCAEAVALDRAETDDPQYVNGRDNCQGKEQR